MILRIAAIGLLLLATVPSGTAGAGPGKRGDAAFHRANESIRARFARLETEGLPDPAFRKEAGKAHAAVASFLLAYPDGGPAAYDKWKKHAGFLAVRMDSLKDAAGTDRSRHLSRAKLLFGALICSAVVDRAKRESKPVLLLLSTSVSCACTMEKCGEQERILSGAERRLKGRVLVVTVDAYHRYDLQQRFEAYFQPTLLVLGADGREIRRFENAVAKEKDILAAIGEARSKHGS